MATVEKAIRPRVKVTMTPIPTPAPNRRPGLLFFFGARPGLLRGARPGLFVWARPGLLLLTAVLTLQPQPAAQTRHRIISLVPAVTEMLFAMGAGAEVVGVSSYDNFPAEVASRPKVGALVDPDFERILSLRPDLVVVYGSQDDLMSRLTRARIGIFQYRHAGLADITSTLRELGTRVGHRDDANRVAASIEVDLRAIQASVAGRARPRTVLVFGREPGTLRSLFATGGVGFLHDLVELSGAIDVFADVKRESLQVSTEQLLARAPDIVLELRASEGWDAVRLERERAVWRQLASVPAVRTDRIYILADSSLTIPGPRVAQAARAIAAVLHPR